MSRAANERDFRSARGEALFRLCGRVRAGITRDNVLERTPGACSVAELGLGARNVEQRVGDLLAVRIRREELPLGSDRSLLIALCELCVAGPVQGGRGQRAPGIAANKRLETGDRRRIAASLEQIERAVVG